MITPEQRIEWLKTVVVNPDPAGDTCDMTRQELIAEVERLTTLLSIAGCGVAIRLGHTDEDLDELEAILMTGKRTHND